MTNESLQATITALSPSAVFEEGGEWLVVNIDAEDWKQLALNLRNEPSLLMDYLFCVTCVDWKTHLTMVYHLSSTTFRHAIVVKSKLDAAEPVIDTVSDIWQTANFNEREAYEMFGVQFVNHPDLRLLILPDGWEGKKPMLKDFEDPINMIRL